MRKSLPVLLALAAAVMCRTGLPAQNLPSPAGSQQQNADMRAAADTSSANSGSEKPPKVRKPLESYLFSDSIRARNHFVWTLDMERNSINLKTIDSMLNIFQVDYPYLRQDVGSAYLGNLGGAAIPLNYFTRPEYEDFGFASAYDVYFFTPGRVPFYNVKTPFTQFSYFTAGQKARAEETLGLSHAQNISPSSGFNMDYKSRGTKGIYNWQKARDKNLSLAFSHTGKKYTVHAGYIYNAAILRENGGIEDDKWITDTILEQTGVIPINLYDATNKLKNNIYYAVQSYGIPLRRLSDDDFSIADRTTLYVGLSTQYSRFSKVYADTRNGSTQPVDGTVFYDNWYVNPAATHDSIFESLLSNKAFIQIQPWSRDAVVGLIDGGAGIDLHHYYQMSMNQYLAGPSGGKTDRQSIYVYGSVEGKLMRYADWSGNLKFHPAGWRQGDLDFGADLSLHVYSKNRPISLSGSFRSVLRTPGFWDENYFSNHFAWSNSFKKENETRLDVTFSVPHLALELGGYQSVLTDKIFYGPDCMPAQASGSVSVTGLYASKNFRFAGFRLDNRVLLQWSTAQRVVPVPMASMFMTYYYDFTVVKNVLHMQVGLDGRYNTPYYAFGYMPATAQFYNQREKQMGDYVMIDAFAAAKWKRMRIMLKMQHLNDDLWGTRNYFSVLHYPLNKRILKLGFSWGFYD